MNKNSLKKNKNFLKKLLTNNKNYVIINTESEREVIKNVRNNSHNIRFNRNNPPDVCNVSNNNLGHSR